MSSRLRARVVLSSDVAIGFGSGVAVLIPLTEEQVYRLHNTGESEDEIAAEIGNAWLRQLMTGEKE